MRAKQMKKLAAHVAAWRLDMGLPIDFHQAPGKPELAFIREELDELGEAQTPVDEMDAIIDILFATLSYATRRYTPEQIAKSWVAVCEANARKAAGPIINGKKHKPKGWFGPEIAIATALEASRES